MNIDMNKVFEAINTFFRRLERQLQVVYYRGIWILGWILVLLMLFAPGAAHADHYDACENLDDEVDMIACRHLATVRLNLFIQQNEELFSPETIIANFEDVTRSWITPIVDIATSIFWTLALIELIMTFGMMAVRGSDLAEFAVEFLKRIIIFSFGWYLLTNPGIFYYVIQGFRDTAAIASGDAPYGIRGILLLPVTVNQLVMNGMEGMNLITDSGQVLMILICGVIILGALAAIAIMLVYVLCEMYIVMTVGLFSLAFFSFQPTREYTMRFFGGVIGTGFKLLALELIISLGLEMADTWTEMPVMHQVGPYLIMAVSAMVYASIAVFVPNYIQSLFSGAPGSGFNPIGAITTGIAAPAAVMAVGGKGIAGGMSVKDAVAAARAAGAGAAGAGVGGVTLAAAKNLGAGSIDHFRRKHPMAAQMRENLMDAGSEKAMKNPETKE